MSCMFFEGLSNLEFIFIAWARPSLTSSPFRCSNPTTLSGSVGSLAYRPFARLRALMRISSSVRSGGGAAAVVAVLA